MMIYSIFVTFQDVCMTTFSTDPGGNTRSRRMCSSNMDCQGALDAGKEVRCEAGVKDKDYQCVLDSNNVEPTEAPETETTTAEEQETTGLLDFTFYLIL